MPAVVPFIPLIAAAVSAGSAAYSGYEAAQSPNTGPTAAQQAQLAAQQKLAAQKAAFLSSQASTTTPQPGTPGSGLTSQQQDVQSLMQLLQPSQQGNTTISGGVGGSTPQPTSGLTTLSV